MEVQKEFPLLHCDFGMGNLKVFEQLKVSKKDNFFLHLYMLLPAPPHSQKRLFFPFKK